MDIKYSKRNSFFLLLVSIFGFIALPLMGLDTFNLEIYNNFPIIPKAYVIYISYPLFYFGYKQIEGFESKTDSNFL